MPQSLSLERALKSIQCHTAPVHQSTAIQRKRRIVERVNEGEFIPLPLLRAGPVLYIGSHTDLPFPLSLGFRKIILLDPSFQSPQTFTSLHKIAREDLGVTIRTSSNQSVFEFEFDFGLGAEEVTVECVAKRYRTPRVTSGKSQSGMDNLVRWAQDSYPTMFHGCDTKEIYVPKQPLGMLLTSHSIGIEAVGDLVSLKRLVVGGFILNDEHQEKAGVRYKDIPLAGIAPKYTFMEKQPLKTTQ